MSLAKQSGKASQRWALGHSGCRDDDVSLTESWMVAVNIWVFVYSHSSTGAISLRALTETIHLMSLMIQTISPSTSCISTWYWAKADEDRHCRASLVVNSYPWFFRYFIIVVAHALSLGAAWTKRIEMSSNMSKLMVSVGKTGEQGKYPIWTSCCRAGQLGQTTCSMLWRAIAKNETWAKWNDQWVIDS
jgi:hypothetical protein